MGIFLIPVSSNPSVWTFDFSSAKIQELGFDANEKYIQIAGSSREMVLGSNFFKGRKFKLSDSLVNLTPGSYFSTEDFYSQGLISGNYILVSGSKNYDAGGQIEDFQFISSISGGVTTYQYLDVCCADGFVYTLAQVGSDTVIERRNASNGALVWTKTFTAVIGKALAVNPQENCLYVLWDTARKISKYWIDDTNYLELIKEVTLDSLLGLSAGTITSVGYLGIGNALLATCASASNNYVIKIDKGDLTNKQNKTYSATLKGIDYLDDNVCLVVQSNGTIRFLAITNLKEIKSVATSIGTAEGLRVFNGYVWIVDTSGTPSIWRCKKDFSYNQELTPAAPNDFSSPRNIAGNDVKIFIADSLKKHVQLRYYSNFKIDAQQYLFINALSKYNSKFLSGGLFQSGQTTYELFCQSPYWQLFNASRAYKTVTNNNDVFDIVLDQSFARIFIAINFQTAVNDINIKNLTTSETATLTGPFAVNDLIFMDNDTGNITLNGKDMIGNFDGNFLKIQKGLNPFRVASSAGSWSTKISIIYFPLML